MPGSRNWFWPGSMCWAGMTMLLPWSVEVHAMGLLSVPGAAGGRPRGGGRRRPGRRWPAGQVPGSRQHHVWPGLARRHESQVLGSLGGCGGPQPSLMVSGRLAGRTAWGSAGRAWGAARQQAWAGWAWAAVQNDIGRLNQWRCAQVRATASCPEGAHWPPQPPAPPNTEFPLSVVATAAGRFFWRTRPAPWGETPLMPGSLVRAGQPLRPGSR